jgi:(p)ppGpp synthase/HD superfamily hydrolase
MMRSSDAEIGPQPGGELDPLAQTVLELFDQLERRGFGVDDMRLVQRAYELASSLTACQYRSSGRSLVDHTMGTASIVASLGAYPAFVAAAMAHAVYVHGDFGTMRKRAGEAERARVRTAIGSDAEEIVARYSQLYWNERSVPSLSENVPHLDARDREALLIRLADQLDIYGTREVLYYDNLDQRLHFARTFGPRVVAMADQLGYPALSAALDRAYADVLEQTVPAGLQDLSHGDETVMPGSYRVRPSVAFYRGVRFRVWKLIGR